MIFKDFSWWSIIYLLITTHITILTVTIYLHRSVAHRSLTVKKPLEHLFRFWCWLTTGQNAREWAAVHRKHHAFCEKEQDPHSPKIYGFWTVLFKGVLLYRNEAKNPETLEKYGKFTPDDWIEHNIYRKNSVLGLVLLALVDILLFNYHGVWIFLIQIVWIPFWAAGVINGLAHFKGYRNFNTNDDSTNILPWGIIIGGEELHNNHHAYPTSAKLSMKWFEFDIGWVWIKLLSYCSLIRINKVHKLPIFDKQNKEITEHTLEAFLNHKYFIWKLFRKQTHIEVSKQIRVLKEQDPIFSNYSVKKLKKLFYSVAESLSKTEKEILDRILKNNMLKKVYDMKENLWLIWNNRQLSYLQIKEALSNWCENAKNSQQHSIMEFSKKIIWLKPAV